MHAIDIIKKFEGLRLKAYKCSANVWTIGYGNTSYLKHFNNPKNIKITEKKAQELLLNDAKGFYNCIVDEVGNICNSNQIASLTSLCFNIGINAFHNSTLLKIIKNNPNNFFEIEKQFMRWIYANGKTIKGLIKRRKLETKIYISSVME